MSAVEDLKAKRERLKSQLADVEVKLRRAMVEAAPYKVGDVVEHRGEEFRIDWVGTSRWFRRVEYTGNPRKKNGEWSKVSRKLYDLGR